MRSQVDTTIREEVWTQTVRKGAKWFFWTLLISTILVNAFGFALPFLGGTRADLKWAGLISALAGITFAYSVFLLTRGVPGIVCNRWIGASIARFVVVVNVVVRFGEPLALYFFDNSISWFVSVGKNLAWLATVVAVFHYLRMMARRFELVPLGRAAGMLAWAFILVWLALPIACDVVGGSLVLGGGLYIVSSEVVKLIVWLWALRVIWRFANSILIAAVGRCVHCGYSLVGLADGRCPECGISFSEEWGKLVIVRVPEVAMNPSSYKP